MKKIIVTFLLSVPCLVYGKNYSVFITPCDIGSNCKKCYERVEITYSINTKKNEVTFSGKESDGKVLKEVVNNCQIKDENNWKCDSPSLVTIVSGGVLSISNKKDTSLSRSKKEMCLVK